MAFKKYAYYNRGNKFAVVEAELSSVGGRNLAVAHCTVGGHTNKTDCEAAGGQWIPSSGSSDLGTIEKYISPASSITDGIEIEYSYAPIYRINDESENIDINSYTEAGGKYRLTLNSNVTLAVGDSVYIQGYNKLNGLHTVATAATDVSALVLETKYNGALNTFATDNKPSLYHDVTALKDEDFELDLPEYQAQAIVYFVKAKLAEDARDSEGREYFMRLFKKQMEKGSSSRKRGPYIMQGFYQMRKF